MILTSAEQAMLDGKQGKSTQKAMEILATLGRIYRADRMVPVKSVQIAGVSYDNLGEAGLDWLQEMADGGGKTRVLTTLNPAGMDIKNWQSLGIDPGFARNQGRVIDAFEKMGATATCTCTPYLVGNLPQFGEHIAWAESSAICYANSVIGARTNREGGPSALAAALTGVTPNYGYHQEEFRRPSLTFKVGVKLSNTSDFSLLGMLIGRKIEATGNKLIPYIQGIEAASLEDLKAFCASIATYGGTGLFHMENITPEVSQFKPPIETLKVSQAELDDTIQSLSNANSEEVDFVSLGCPHLSIHEIARLAELLNGKLVKKEFWITTARPTREIADHLGYSLIIEQSGAKFAVDTCCVVAPIRGRFRAMTTDSAKACYYASGKNHFNVLFKPFEEVVGEALK